MAPDVERDERPGEKTRAYDAPEVIGTSDQAEPGQGCSLSFCAVEEPSLAHCQRFEECTLMSRTRLLALTLPVFASLSLAETAAYAGDQDFKLENQTGYQIDEVRVSPASSSSWGNDIMGTGVLENGKLVNIVFKPDNSVCKYDLQVVYQDKTKAEWGNLDLCTISKVTIYWNQGTGVTRAVTE